MDIKKMLLEIINSKNNIGYAYGAIEKLVFIMMNDYLQRQGKPAALPNINRDISYDLFLPEGIDDIQEPVAVEIKMFRNVHMLSNKIYDMVGRIVLNGRNFDSLLLIIINEVPKLVMKQIKEKCEHLNFTLYIWDIDNLVKIFETNEDLFAETYNNLNKTLLHDTIRRGIDRKSEAYLEKRAKYIEQLKREYENDNVVLFLGAGASKDAQIATWDTLISELFVALIDKQLSTNHIQMKKSDKENILNEVKNQHGNSPLLQARFLRGGFEDEFEELVRGILYKNADKTSDLLEEIGQLCIPNRGKLGIRAIVNYNFDDLVEKNLRRLRVKYHSIYEEGITPDLEELGVYHVHGFLPQKKEGYDNLTKSLLVFSEEGYHKLMLEPYNWANMCQLNFMMNNTCIFIGLSMTDPNMRRLLEIANQKKSEENAICKHYAIMRRLHINGSEKSDEIKSFEGVNEALQESFFEEIGINVIWIDNYNEIPILLQQIKGKYE